LFPLTKQRHLITLFSVSFLIPFFFSFVFLWDSAKRNGLPPLNFQSFDAADG